MDSAFLIGQTTEVKIRTVKSSPTVPKPDIVEFSIAATFDRTRTSTAPMSYSEARAIASAILSAATSIQGGKS